MVQQCIFVGPDGPFFNFSLHRTIDIEYKSYSISMIERTNGWMNE